MNYFKPHPLLQAYIKYYAIFDIPKIYCPEEIKFIPNGLTYLVINLKDPFIIKSNLYKDPIKKDGELFVGQQTTYYHLAPQGDYSSLCIIFQPAGLYRLLKIPHHEIIDYAVPIKSYLKSGMNSVIDKVKETTNKLSVTNILNNYFIKLLPGRYTEYQFIEYIIDKIEKTKGLINTSELSNMANTSLRNFRRRFSEIVGISPKKFIMINRLNHIIKEINCNNPMHINWLDISYEYGYYDQMHLIKTIRNFCGECPTKLVTDITKKQKVETYFHAVLKDI